MSAEATVLICYLIDVSLNTFQLFLSKQMWIEDEMHQEIYNYNFI